MRLIKPSFEIKEQESGLNGVYKQIEWAGRHCYKSLDKITEDSAKGFVDRMINSGHGAMLEHGTVYLIIKWWHVFKFFKYLLNPHSKIRRFKYITTNLRVLVENNWLDDLEYLCEPTEHHKKRITVKFTTDQGILREFTRHRVFSFAVESTRYCNYSKNKFDGEVTYILPSWIDEATLPPKIYFHCSDDWGTAMCEHYYDFTEEGKKDWDVSDADTGNFLFALDSCEQMYLSLIKQGWQPQQARNILPLATKCEMIMTGFASDWEHFFFLRTPVNAHPQARELAIPLKGEFIKRNLI